MNRKADRILVLGYGNPGRGDDGLGPAFAEAVERLGIGGVTAKASYQLTIEDAATVAENEMVLFVDAAMKGPGPFTLLKMRPHSALSFSSHHVPPPFVLGLAQEFFEWDGEAYLLGIRGFEFDRFDPCLSQRAESNLKAALDFIVPALRRGLLRKRKSEAGDRPMAAAFSVGEVEPCLIHSP